MPKVTVKDVGTFDIPSGKRLVLALVDEAGIAIERGGVRLLPTADSVLLAGDHLSILAPGDQPDAPLEIVRLCTGL